MVLYFVDEFLRVLDAGVQRQETEDSLILTISIPKSRAAETVSPHT